MSPFGHACTHIYTAPLRSLTLSTVSKECRPTPRRMKSYTLIDFSELEATSQSPTDQFANVTTASRHGSTTSTCLLDEELKSLGLYMQFSTVLTLLLEFTVFNKDRRSLTLISVLREIRPFSSCHKFSRCSFFNGVRLSSNCC